MGPDIYTVTEIGRGFLAVMAKPVAGEWIDDEFLGIARFGIKCLVSLLESHEIRDLGLSKAPMLCELNGVDYINFPIPDRGVPALSPKIYGLIEGIHQRIHRGENTVIHCRAGIGRTGLLAASILVKDGYSPVEAFALVSKARGVQVPDTQEQYDWVVGSRDKLQRT